MTEFKMDPTAHIGAVALQVSDLGQSESFYTGVLGLDVIERGDGRLIVGAGGVGLVRLEEIKGALPRPQRSTGLYHLALLVPSRPALGRALRRLIETKWPLHGAADHLVSEALYLVDPDRNGIEIYRDRPKSEWAFDGDFVRMANEPVDLESLLAEADVSVGSEPPEPPTKTPSPSPGTRHPGQGAGARMGHVHLHVRDLDEAEAFYYGVMGFDVMLRWPPSALFIAAGGYHHHIGLNTWAGVGAPPPPDDAAGLKWFEAVLPDSAAVGKVVARLEGAGIAVEGRSDGVFVRDPSMNGILLVSTGP